MENAKAINLSVHYALKSFAEIRVCFDTKVANE